MKMINYMPEVSATDETGSRGDETGVTCWESQPCLLIIQLDEGYNEKSSLGVILFIYLFIFPHFKATQMLAGVTIIPIRHSVMQMTCPPTPFSTLCALRQDLSINCWWDHSQTGLHKAFIQGGPSLPQHLFSDAFFAPMKTISIFWSP